MSIKFPPFWERVEFLRAAIGELFDDFDETVRAVVADGWPEQMAREGLMLHRRTWDVDGLVEALDRELHGYGGVAALSSFSATRDAHEHIGARIIAPEQIVHLWPSLPGAGVTPVLFGWLLGAAQIVRPSSRGVYFAHRFHKAWHFSSGGRALLSLEFGAPNDSWRDVDAIIMSGSDEAIAALRDFIGHGHHRGRPTFLTYGHRVSFGVVVDDGESNLAQIAMALATDVVLWHQLGCLSARAIVFNGTRERMERFGHLLGEAIEEREKNLGATTLGEDRLARRVQARGVAEFLGHCWGDGLGWVQLTSSPWLGDTVSAHTVTLHHTNNLDELRHVIKVPRHQLQGAALWTKEPGPVRRAWAEELARLGVNRICAPGHMQAPSPSWAHDGWPNAMDFVRICASEI